jgi:hypothetical protein
MQIENIASKRILIMALLGMQIGSVMGKVLRFCLLIALSFAALTRYY